MFSKAESSLHLLMSTAKAPLVQQIAFLTDIEKLKAMTLGGYV